MYRSSKISFISLIVISISLCLRLAILRLFIQLLIMPTFAAVEEVVDVRSNHQSLDQ